MKSLSASISVSVFRSRIIYIPDATTHNIIGVVKYMAWRKGQGLAIDNLVQRERVVSLIKFIDTFLERLL